MAQIEVRSRSGASELRDLDRKTQVTIGSSPAADLPVSSDGVLGIECRISWGGDAFVMTAVNPDGVYLNGNTVKRAALADGDVLRIADVEFLFIEGNNPLEVAKSSSGMPVRQTQSGEVKLKEGDSSPDVAKETILSRERNKRAAREAREGCEDSDRPSQSREIPTRGEGSKSRGADSRDSRSGMSEEATRKRVLSELLDEEESSSSGQRGGSGSGKGNSTTKPTSSPPPDPVSRALADANSFENRGTPMLLRGGGTIETDPGKPVKESIRGSVSSFLRPKPTRPGEQELHRSPLVVGMTVGALILTLAALTLWFLLGREFMNRKFEAAQAALDGGQYAQAIDAFNKFAAEYPKTPEATQAQVNVGKARVEQAVSGAIPDWELGLKTLNEFVNQYRDSETFRASDSPLKVFARQAADRIALGSAKSAGALKKRNLLGVSNDARALLEFLTPAEERSEEQLTAIATAHRSSEAIILQQETFDAALAKMKEAIAGNQQLQALLVYRGLLDRYSSAISDRTIQAQLRQALEADAKFVTRTEPNAAAAQTNDEPSPPAVTLTRRVRARTDVTSVGTTVASISEGAMFGVDTVMGDVLWRRSVGVDSPFPPVPVQSASPGWLAYDSARRQLICVKERTGELIWAAPLADIPTGGPLIHEGQIFLATQGGTIAQIDLQSGEVNALLKFSQPLVGPPAVSSKGDRMYVVGRESTLYVLSRRPLACQHAVFLGHGAASIRAPGIMLRDYLLLAENRGADRCLIRLLDTTRDPKAPPEIAKSEIEGQVYNTPVVRGKQVIVPSSPERLSAFVIAETGDAQSLTKVASYQVPGPQPVPMHVLLGPDDQFWMSSTALRRFDVKVDSIIPDKQQIAVGQTSQPMSSAADSLFVGRRAAFSRAVLLGCADRQKMLLEWQTVLGAGILEATDPGSDGAAVAVTSQGEVFHIATSKLTKGSIELQPTTVLTIDEKVASPIGAVRMKDGRVAVWAGGEVPKLWVISNDSAPRETKLDLPLQAAPVRLTEGLVLPLPGRLRLASRTTGAPPVQEWAAPVQAGAAPVWRGLANASDTSFVALDASGKLILVQLRSAPKPHLAEVAQWESGNPVDLPLTSAGERVIVANAKGRVVALDAASLEPVGQYDLERPATRAPLVIGQWALVDSGRQSLVCLDINARLKEVWKVPLDGNGIVGGLEWKGQLLLARDDGLLLSVNPTTGETRTLANTNERLLLPPRIWGDRLVIGTLDGTLLSFPLEGGILASTGANP